ncbi:nitronate monooxygenase [Nocardia caishijiensis]|uniref:Propionate 3-nitronate monooxygenase n=1 Tax=Nocardia caishijiensis TaxID=184756 RepID=A0ABQ6YQN9_9NOCA|nr:nitronate monooxygenase [Nocardia caishijiensis]KAF0848147.1 nitroalkane oxidase [Nocardia caishijiensis]
MVIESLRVPVVAAPMAGGPSTPELVAAVSAVGGFAQLAAGYLSTEAVAAQIAATRSLTSRPFGVNLFAPGPVTEPAAYAEYLAELGAEFPLGTPAHDTDGWADKIDLLVADPVAVVSTTFGCPTAVEIDRLHAVGTEVWVTVTAPDEARIAIDAGADALIAQGAEAGGHRATFLDDPAADPVDPIGLLSLLQLLTATTDRPLVAAGGIVTGAGVAAVLAAGAAAAQLGTALVRCPEAGTNAVHRGALGSTEPTMLTRAFTGRRARGIRNRFLLDHTANAPAAYPEIHYATAPLRAAGRSAGNADQVNLWAGQTHSLTTGRPAGELVTTLWAEANAALRRAIRD